MTEIRIELPSKRNREESLRRFAQQLEKFTEDVGMKQSARGWAYQLEGMKLITKAQLDLVENLINECRKRGYLPIDFTAEEEGRKFSGIEVPEKKTPLKYLRGWLNVTINSAEYYTPNWWLKEKYYIQMLVEKIDLKNLYEPICKEYHIPSATSKGWSSVIQRGEYARRFKEAEELGLKCVLLYCGDHDCDGLRISDNLRKNLEDIMYVHWEDGTEGYDPCDLIIERFGLNYDFIMKNHLTWIDNLITGSKKNLASPSHKNYRMPYVQDYIKKYGVRKCEANAILIAKEAGKKLCRDAIEKYIGHDSLERFEERRQEIRNIVNDFFGRTGLDKELRKGIDLINKDEKDNEDDGT
ncbi:MAG: hypothetical protein IMZ53_12520 [Thermoplasmata archaeon]|nr:hypothetical protein [Thermoplasmata archaeon]MBE3141390.1 hypothetical protein [Thermoplasmata archaeon]